MEGLRDQGLEVVEGVVGGVVGQVEDTLTLQNLKRSVRKCNDKEKLKNEKKKKTVLNALLDDVVNGNKILSQCLDDLITKTTDNPDSEHFALRINFEGFIKTNSTKQCRHLFQIFNKSKSGKIPDTDFPIVRHPVIALFIWKKWKKAIWFFLLNAVLYGIFLFNYTWIILEIFSNDKGNGNIKGNRTDSRNETNGSCQSDHYKDNFGFSGNGLIISVVLLSLWEIMQMLRLGKLYFKEVENYIEIFVFATAFLLIEDINSCLNDDYRRGIVAVGISLGWIELVFLTGRLGLIAKSVGQPNIS